MSKPVLRHRSCAACAVGKRSCDHVQPVCGRCKALGIECVIAEDKRSTKRKLHDDDASVSSRLPPRAKKSGSDQALTILTSSTLSFSSVAAKTAVLQPSLSAASIGSNISFFPSPWTLLQKSMSLFNSCVSVLNILPAFPFATWLPTTPQAVRDSGQFPVEAVLMEDLHQEFVANSTRSIIRLLYEEPTPAMVTSGCFLKPVLAYGNHAFIKGMGMPAPIPQGSLCYMPSVSMFSTHVHPQDRTEHAHKLVMAVLQHAPLVKVSVRIHQQRGWTAATELIELSYTETGFLRALTVTMMIEPLAELMYYPQDVPEMAINPQGALTSSSTHHTSSGDVICTVDKHMYDEAWLTTTATPSIRGVPVLPICRSTLVTEKRMVKKVQPVVRELPAGKRPSIDAIVTFCQQGLAAVDVGVTSTTSVGRVAAFAAGALPTRRTQQVSDVDSISTRCASSGSAVVSGSGHTGAAADGGPGRMRASSLGGLSMSAFLQQELGACDEEAEQEGASGSSATAAGGLGLGRGAACVDLGTGPHNVGMAHLPSFPLNYGSSQGDALSAIGAGLQSGESPLGMLYARPGHEPLSRTVSALSSTQTGQGREVEFLGSLGQHLPGGGAACVDLGTGPHNVGMAHLPSFPLNYGSSQGDALSAIGGGLFLESPLFASSRIAIAADGGRAGASGGHPQQLAGFTLTGEYEDWL